MRINGLSGCRQTPKIATQQGWRTLPCTCTSAMKSRKSRFVRVIFAFGCFNANAVPFQYTRVTSAKPPSLLGVDASGTTSVHCRSKRSPRGIFLAMELGTKEAAAMERQLEWCESEIGAAMHG